VSVLQSSLACALLCCALQSSVVPAVASPNAVGFKALLSSCFPF
jgi:hypothetical protein